MGGRIEKGGRRLKRGVRARIQLDEIDKVPAKELAVLLPVLEGRRLVVRKHGKAASIDLAGMKAVATANVAFRKTKVWEQVSDRMLVVEFDAIPPEEFRQLILREVPNADPEVVEAVVKNFEKCL